MKDNLRFLRKTLEATGSRSQSAMLDINRASLVMLHEQRIIDRGLAVRLAGGLRTLEQRRASDAASGLEDDDDYLAFEKDLVSAVGEDASWIHVGRSRQDIYSTIVHLWMRDGLLQLATEIQQLRRSLLASAEKHAQVLIPTFTHGVQAQPTTFGHYLLALAFAFERLMDRSIGAFQRISQCPLGAGVLATSRFPVDRVRLADLLGFESVRENAFDANHVAPADSAVELGSICTSAAVLASQVAQDLHTPFLYPKPWLAIELRELNGISSMMPQKRNPRVLEFIREYAAIVLGGCHASLLLSHNVASGMTDLREGLRDTMPVPQTHALLVLMRQTIEAIAIDERAALAAIDGDYSTMTQLSEDLLAYGGSSFRQAHHFASRLTDFGRSNALSPAEIKFADVREIHLETTGKEFPMSAPEYSRAIDPAHFVATRQGRGGPQAPELARMQQDCGKKLASDEAWLSGVRNRIQLARTTLLASIASLS